MGIEFSPPIVDQEDPVMVAAPEVGAEMPVISKERWEEMRRMAYVKPSGYAKRGANAFLRIRVVPFPRPSRLRGACVDLSGFEYQEAAANERVGP